MIIYIFYYTSIYFSTLLILHFIVGELAIFVILILIKKSLDQFWLTFCVRCSKVGGKTSKESVLQR